VNDYTAQIDKFPVGAIVRVTREFDYATGHKGGKLIREPVQVGLTARVDGHCDDGRARFNCGPFGMHTFSYDDVRDVPFAVVSLPGDVVIAELVEACKTTLAALDKIGSGGFDLYDADRCAAILRAALAQARGEGAE